MAKAFLILVLMHFSGILGLRLVKEPLQLESGNAVAHYTDGNPATFFGLFAMRAQMLKFNSIAKHVVLIANENKELSEAFNQICQEIGVHDVIPVDGSFLQTRLRDCVEPCWKKTFNKLTAFNQTDKGFDKLVLVDSDVFAVNNFDKLFEHKPVGMVKWQGGEHNGGVLLLKPQKELFDQMVATFPELSRLDTPLRGGPKEPHYGDQSFLRQFLLGHNSEHTLNDLPSNFNVRSASVDAYDAVDMIHFTVQKPYRDGGPISQINATRKVAKYICEFIAAAYSTLEKHPALRANTHFGHRFEDWGALVGNPQVVHWAGQACPQLPSLPASSMVFSKVNNLDELHNSFTAALDHSSWM